MQHTCSSARDEPLSAFVFAKDLPWFSWDIALGLLVPGVSWGAVSRCPGVLEAPKGHPALEVSAFRMGGKWDGWSPSRAAGVGGGLRGVATLWATGISDKPPSVREAFHGAFGVPVRTSASLISSTITAC